MRENYRQGGLPVVRFDQRDVETEHGWLLKHRQTKGAETDRPNLPHRATSRLYLFRLARRSEPAS